MELASEFIEGSLGTEQRSQIQAHLDACACCTETMTDVGRIVHGLRGLRRITPSVAFDFVLRGLVRRELHRSRYGRSRPLGWLIPEGGLSLQVVLLAALVVFLGVLAVDGLWEGFSDRRRAQQARSARNAALVSAEQITDHYVLEGTTLEELGPYPSDTTAAGGLGQTTLDTSLLSSEGWEPDRTEKVKLVTF